jgi:phosphoglycolate phosphatase
MFGDSWEQARDIFYAAFRGNHLDHVTPMPGAAEALLECAPWPCGVVSNKAGKYLRAEVVHLGWSSHFGPVIGAGDARADKPDPAPILMALDQLGRSADRTVWYLGDTTLDMAAARAAGVTAVLVGDAAHDGGVELASPDLHVHSAHELAAWLKSLA